MFRANKACRSGIFIFLLSLACIFSAPALAVADTAPATAAIPTTAADAIPAITVDVAASALADAKAPATEPALTEEEQAIADFKAEVLRLVNEKRAEAGLNALAGTEAVGNAADVRAEEAAGYFSHTRPDGSACFTVFAAYGITYLAAGENLAYGYDTPAEVVEAWMNSPGHKANILNARYTMLGVGYFEKSNGKIYCSQLFYAPKFTFHAL